MKKITAFIISAMMLLHCISVLATQMANRSEIRAFIDYTPIDSYVIDGYTYVSADELVNYGFDVEYDEATRRLNVSRIKFATPMYTREMWEKSTVMQTGAEIGNSDISVYLDGERTDSYFVDGENLIRLDALGKYGTCEEKDYIKMVSVTMFKDEMQKEFDDAKSVVEIEISEDEKYTGQVDKNNVPNGMGILDISSDLTTVRYMGYFVDGKPDGLVYKQGNHHVSRMYTTRETYFIGTLDGKAESKREYITTDDYFVRLTREPNFGVCVLPKREIREWTGPEILPDKDVYTEGCYYERWYGMYDQGEYISWHDGESMQTVADLKLGGAGNVYNGTPTDELDILQEENDRVESLAEFYEYTDGEEKFAQKYVQTRSKKGEPVRLNNPADGAGELPFNLSVWIYGRAIDFDVDPIIQDGRVLVPVRRVAEMLNAYVSWNKETRTVEISKDDKTISMQIGNNEIKVGDETITIDVPPQIVDDRTLVPLRAVSEGLGADVKWNEHSKRVTITD